MVLILNDHIDDYLILHNLIYDHLFSDSDHIYFCWLSYSFCAACHSIADHAYFVTLNIHIFIGDQTIDDLTYFVTPIIHICCYWGRGNLREWWANTFLSEAHIFIPAIIVSWRQSSPLLTFSSLWFDGSHHYCCSHLYLSTSSMSSPVFVEQK